MFTTVQKGEKKEEVGRVCVGVQTDAEDRMNAYKQILLVIIVTNVEKEDTIAVTTPGLCELPYTAQPAHRWPGKDKSIHQ